MNGTKPKIEIFKPFGEAFELMKRILFQPFDLKKWFVIGFAAWLANLGGGGGFNYPSDRGEQVKKVNDAISQIPHPILLAGIVFVTVLVLVLIVVFASLQYVSRMRLQHLAEAWGGEIYTWDWPGAKARRKPCRPRPPPWYGADQYAQ